MTRGPTPPPEREPYVPKHAPTRSDASGRAAASTGPASTRATKGPPPGKKKSFLRRKWWLLLLLTPLVVMAFAGIGLYVAYARITLPTTLPPIQTTYLYDRNGHLLTTLHGSVDRTVVPLSQISPHMIDAVIATEDHDFYNHPGVDVAGIARAAYTDLVKRSTVQGASTITEQLVKNVYAGSYTTDADGVQSYVLPQRSIQEKIREALLAVKLEQQLGKDQILEKYLNTVYFGHGAYGVEAAARTYFGEHASQLSILESASLAGVLHAPDLYDPIDHPSDNWYRRNYAVDQMVRYGYLESGEGERLKKHKCCGTIPDQQDLLVAPGQSEYFVSYVRQLLFDRYGEATVYSGGMRVTTTLDLNLQRAAEHAIADALPDPHDPAAALVSIDPRTGEILAMAGGRDWSKNKVNYATGAGGSGRQSGSAFKAFTLAAAMKQGYDLRKYWQGPATIGIPQCPDATQPDGIWHPVNAGDGEAGTFTLAGATAHSVNTVFAQLIAQLGPKPVVEMAHALGIQSDLPVVCSVTLGSVAVNPLEMTNAYATIADQGVRHWANPLLQVKTEGGRIDDTVASVGEEVLVPNDANLVTYALQGVVREGTGTDAAISGFPVAGKTGTANDNVDAWFCGYTVQIVTCVWVGWPKGEIPLEDIEGVPSVYGGTIPAAIWHSFMTIAMQGQTPESFPVPSFDGNTIGPSVAVSSPAPSISPSPSVTPSPKPSHSPSPTGTPSPTTTPSPTGSPSSTPSSSASGP
ncbi:MAG: transglycosylase domain-containing protein [Actinomycetota bacterium]